MQRPIPPNREIRWGGTRQKGEDHRGCGLPLVWEDAMTDRVPAEVFPPGEFLRDELEARNWTQGEFAEIIGRSQRLVNEIISGKRGITPSTAKELAAALGTSPYFWLNLEASYRLDKSDPAPDTISRSARLRGRFPVRDMIKRGWIEASHNPDVLETRVLKHFDLNSIDGTISFSHAARRTASQEERLTPTQCMAIPG